MKCFSDWNFLFTSWTHAYWCGPNVLMHFCSNGEVRLPYASGSAQNPEAKLHSESGGNHSGGSEAPVWNNFMFVCCLWMASSTRSNYMASTTFITLWLKETKMERLCWISKRGVPVSGMQTPTSQLFYSSRGRAGHSKAKLWHSGL